MAGDAEKLKSLQSAASTAAKSHIATMGSMVLSATALPVIAGLIKYYTARKDIKQELSDLTSSYNQMTKMDPALSENKSLSSERFRELSAIAPNIAKNPKMALKVIAPRIQSGFDVDDIHKLTMIQSHMRKAPHLDNAFDSATSTGALVLDRVFTTFGPDALRNLQNSAHDVNEARQKVIAFQKGHTMKKQSSPAISEECAIEMCAERYVMWKQANAQQMVNAAGHAAGAIGKGAGAFAQGLKFFAAPLAMAGVIHGVGALLDAKKKRELEAQAQTAFNEVKKNSEVIKANPQMAADAFDALKTFAPSLATKPVLVRTFVEHACDKGMIAPQTVNELASAQGNANRAKIPGFAQGFFGALTPALSAGKQVSEKGEDV